MDARVPVSRPAGRILAIGLDGFEITLAEAMMDKGRLPNLRRLRDASARFRLHHDGKNTGLAWEHFSTGRSPQNQGRYAAVTFDPARYSVRQEELVAVPFLADWNRRVVAFDMPYFDMSQAPGVVGITSWGAHDPGTGPASQPAALRAEVEARFGPYPAPEWIYGFSWHSVEKTRASGAALARAVRQRTEITRWLLAERFPDWQVGIVVVAEPHSAVEPFWHGVDPAHPLHGVPSAPFARAAIERLYEEIDGMIGTLATAFPDAELLVFGMHGMGPNTGDVPAMVLVPELLYRHAFGKPYARPYRGPALPSGIPIMDGDDTWEDAMRRAVPWAPARGALLARVRNRLFRRRGPVPGREGAGNLGWMPAARYTAFWPRMPAFAFPAYYDAQIRLNVRGRERDGTIKPADYAAARDRIAALVSECRDAVSGRPVVEELRLAERDPGEVGPTECDIAVGFAPATTGLVHPRLGTIGPYPYRRTGGHTGAAGFLFAQGVGAPGDRGFAEAYDVVPTLTELAGEPARSDLSGRSLVSRLAASVPG